jgi:hypothetical protein
MFRKFDYSILAESKYLFYFVLLLNLVLLCFTKFYPSVDGPAHLYNSNILNHLIMGDSALSEFYSVNIVPIPNWTSNFILSIFHIFMSAWLAEKLLFIIYVSGMALSFRFLIKELRPENISFSILIFPFIYSFLFHLGLYNFCFSFILFFTTLGFWLRNHASERVYNYFILFLLITITYFSNVLLFGFLGLTIGLYIFYFTYDNYINGKNISLAIRFGGRKLLFLLIVSVPSLIFLLIFYKSVTFFPSAHSYEGRELVKWINDARPFIVYDYVGEEIITEQFFHVLLILLAISFFHKNRAKENGQFSIVGKADIILIPLIISIILFFCIPDGSSAGMMSDRYCLIIFIFILIWVVSRALPNKLNSFIIFFILVLHFGLLFKHLNATIKKLDSNAVSIQKTGEYINANNIVLPINLSDNWMELHFSNYLGVDKPMILLENYEASVDWFPIKWNYKKIPNILLGDRNSISGIHWISNSNSMNIRQIDNILLYGNMSNINNPNWKELKELLTSDFKLKYNSKNNYVMLYEKLQQ